MPQFHEVKTDITLRNELFSEKQNVVSRNWMSNLHKPGGIAQLGEHLLCKQGVIGSIPIISTKMGL